MDGRTAGQDQAFEVRIEHPADIRADLVRALAGILGDRVGGGINDVDIVPEAADEGGEGAPAVQRVIAFATQDRVVAAAAVQDIGRGVALDPVRQRVARAVDRSAAGQDQAFQIGAERPGDGGPDLVRAAIEDFARDVPGIVHDEGVVAGAANEGVDPTAAVERIVAFAAGERTRRRVADDEVVRRVARAGDGGAAREDEVLEIVGEGPGDGGEDAVAALIGLFRQRLARAVHVVGIVAGATHEGVDAGAAGHHVVASAAEQKVHADAAREGVALGGADEHQARGGLHMAERVHRACREAMDHIRKRGFELQRPGAIGIGDDRRADGGRFVEHRDGAARCGGAGDHRVGLIGRHAADEGGVEP